MKKHLLSMLLIPFLGFGQLLEEYFESGIPASWTVQQTNVNETWGTQPGGTGFTGNVAAVDYDEDLGLQNEMLITPSLDLTDVENARLRFKMGMSYYWGVDPNDNYDCIVKVSTDNGSTWTEIWTEDELGVFTNFIANSITVDLSAYDGQSNVKIAFTYFGSDGAAIYLDDVIVDSDDGTVEYCGPLTFTTTVEPITKVTIADIDNASTAVVGGTTPGHEFFLDIIGNMVPGESYSISLEGNTNGNYTNRFVVFIDWNQNGTLNDAGEVFEIGTILNSNGTDGQQATGTIVVPDDAVVGNTRMRVKKIFSTTNFLNPCLGAGYGQAEDYTINIIGEEEPVEYCTVDIPADRVEPITRVVVAGIDNASSPVVDGSAPHEFFLDIEGTVQLGETYPIALEGNTDGPYFNAFTVFVDWNQDGDFTDEGELYESGSIQNSNGTDGQQAIGSLVVPADALLGTTRMRIIKDFTLSSSPVWPSDPCGTYDFGQAEDYTLIVTEGEEEPVEGCLDTPNGQYPSTAYTPSCNGTTEVITDLGWFGEFSMVNVTAGTEYIFSTDVTTAFITIANAAGDTAIITGTGSVTWTSTITGQVQFITHENDECLSSQEWVERYIQCGEIVPPPPYDPCAPIHTGIATNGVGFVNNGSVNYMAANDFNVLANTQFEVEKFTINVVSLGGEPSTFDLKFFEGESGVETQFGETLTDLTPSAITENGTFGSTGYPVYSVEITLPNPIVFPATATEDKKYWVGMTGMPSVDGNTVFWVSSDYVLTDTLPTWQSADGGETWAIFVAQSGANVEGDLEIEGECQTLGLADLNNAQFSYYPNPAVDVVNITSEKGVEKVEVFNLAGQSVISNSKVVNGQVNVSALASGNYVFRVTLEGGQIETFKIIKK